MNILLGKEDAGRDYVIQQNLNNTLSIIKEQWKYIEPSDGPALKYWTKTELGNDKKPQLYDISSDPSEKVNVAEQNSKKVKELASLLEQIKKQ